MFYIKQERNERRGKSGFRNIHSTKQNNVISQVTGEQLKTYVFCSLSQLPSPSQRWQRGHHGGRHSCQRGRPALKIQVHRKPLAQTLTPSQTSRKTRLQLPPRPPVSRPTSPARTPASSATRPTTTPTWSRSSMSRHVAGIWRCRAPVDSRRKGGFAQLFL